MDLIISDEPDQQRYVARRDGELVGLIAYQVDGTVITMVHTEVLPAYEGQGVAGRLARYALDDTRQRGRHVRPVCPYVDAWIKRHPDYADLVEAQR